MDSAGITCPLATEERKKARKGRTKQYLRPSLLYIFYSLFGSLAFDLGAWK
jgi:hypothetical protein